MKRSEMVSLLENLIEHHVYAVEDSISWKSGAISEILKVLEDQGIRPPSVQIIIPMENEFGNYEVTRNINEWEKE